MYKYSDFDLLPDSRGVLDTLVFYSAKDRCDKLVTTVQEVSLRACLCSCLAFVAP